MANVKKLFTSKVATGSTVYAIILRDADLYLLDDADGTFSAAPADPYLSLAEHATIKGYYAVSESRTAWNAGRYKVFVYKQAGVGPVPVADTISEMMDFNVVGDRIAMYFPFEVGAVVTDAGNSVLAFKTTLINTTGSYCVGTFVKFASGNLVEQQKKIVAYSGASQIITVASAFTEIPAAGDEFFMVNQ